MAEIKIYILLLQIFVAICVYVLCCAAAYYSIRHLNKEAGTAATLKEVVMVFIPGANLGVAILIMAALFLFWTFDILDRITSKVDWKNFPEKFFK